MTKQNIVVTLQKREANAYNSMTTAGRMIQSFLDGNDAEKHREFIALAYKDYRTALSIWVELSTILHVTQISEDYSRYKVYTNKVTFDTKQCENFLNSEAK